MITRENGMVVCSRLTYRKQEDSGNSERARDSGGWPLVASRHFLFSVEQRRVSYLPDTRFPHVSQASMPMRCFVARCYS